MKEDLLGSQAAFVNVKWKNFESGKIWEQFSIDEDGRSSMTCIFFSNMLFSGGLFAFLTLHASKRKAEINNIRKIKMYLKELDMQICIKGTFTINHTWKLRKWCSEDKNIPSYMAHGSHLQSQLIRMYRSIKSTFSFNVRRLSGD
jgi:hypothetical protein